MGRLGIIAGRGEIVDLALESLRGQGESPFVVDVTGGEVLERMSWVEGVTLGVGQVGGIIKALKDQQVDRVLFVGKVDKRLIYKRKRLDLRAAKVLLSLRDFSDDSILNAVIKELAREGMEVVGQKEVLADMVPGPGVLGGTPVDDRVMSDVAFGFHMARQVGDLGIGQTVVVKDRCVVAVEAVEGTDETIKRGGALAGPGVVVVKVKRPSQSPLLDVPTVGLKTLEVMEGVGGRALAVEAGETLVLGLEKVARRADEVGISLLAVNEEFLKEWLES